MQKITDIRAHEILDSRGNPTVEAVVSIGSVTAKAAVPSGASTGSHEALELRDGDEKRYRGQGVLKAVAHVNDVLRKKLVGADASAQRRLDEAMLAIDGTENKSRLGANAILAVSLAAARAAATAEGIPLHAALRRAFGIKGSDIPMPLPMMNILNGGAHADFAVDIQECVVIPKMKTFRERVRAGSEIFHALGSLLKKEGFATTVGDEGGYAPKLGGNEKAFALILDAIEEAGYAPGREVSLGADIAASEFYDEKKRRYTLKADGKTLDGMGMVALVEKWLKKYPLATIEDPLAEDDWDHWEELTRRFGKKLSIVGDDLFVTNVKRIEQGIARRAANAVLIKLNQIGTLSETMDAIFLAQRAGYKIAVSNRSGETADTFIADLAVAVRADYIKTGSLSRSERLEKYNRLMEIEASPGG